MENDVALADVLQGQRFPVHFPDSTRKGTSDRFNRHIPTTSSHGTDRSARIN